jgi:hypothetical protein
MPPRRLVTKPKETQVNRVLLLASSVFAFSNLAILPASAAAPNFDGQRISSDVQTISSDAFEGRGVATRAEVRTIEYLVSQFRSAGLQPGGDLVGATRSWTQAVPLLKSEFVGDPTIQLNLAGGSLPLIQREQIAVRAPMDGSKAISLAKVPLVFVGYGVTAPERGWDDYKGVDVRGKMLVMLINDPDLLRALDLQI